MDTTHAVAALIGAWLAAPFALVVGVWLGTREFDREQRAAYRRGRAAAFEEMGRRRVEDAGQRLLDEITEAVEMAEWSRHG